MVEERKERIAIHYDTTQTEMKIGRGGLYSGVDSTRPLMMMKLRKKILIETDSEYKKWMSTIY